MEGRNVDYRRLENLLHKVPCFANMTVGKRVREPKHKPSKCKTWASLGDPLDLSDHHPF